MSSAKSYQNLAHSPYPSPSTCSERGADEIENHEWRSYQAGNGASPSRTCSLSCGLDQEEHDDSNSRNPVGKDEPITPEESQSIVAKSLLRIFLHPLEVLVFDFAG